MTKSITETWSWMDDVLPIVAMVIVTCVDMAILTIVKSAMDDGMGSLAYVVYRNAFGTLFLFPFYIFHIFRTVDRPPLTFRILLRFFILGLFGLCLFQVLWYLGVNYSSTIVASAILNLAPAITFLIAVMFRMEKIDIRIPSSVAKLLGTMIAISGAMVLTFYQGPEIFHMTGFPNSSNQLLLSKPSKWMFGSLITLTSITFACIWGVLQTKTAREYPDQQTIIFFFCLFGTLQCIAISPFLEQNLSAWVLRPGVRLIAVALGAGHSTVVNINVVTWCLRKKGPVFVGMFSPLTIVITIVMGVTFLGDSLYLGSAIGATIVAAGFYMVIWGQAKEKNTRLVVTRDGLNAGGPGSSDPLISSSNESEC